MNHRTSTRDGRFPLALGLAVAVLALSGCKAKQAEQAATAEPTVPSSEMVVQNPTEPAVPVNLPTTAMTNVPPSPAPAPAATGK